MDDFIEWITILGGAILFIVALIGVVVVIDNVGGFRQDREEYKQKCEAADGLVYHPKDEPRRCIKKEFFIQMEK